MLKISVVINTLNEANTLARAIKSVRDFADEIVICDMYSTDDSVAIARRLDCKVVFHKKVEFVEPARNFAISKASGDWILILDPDEEIPVSLGEKIKELATNSEFDFIRLPRKNLIFGKWMKASMWWPDFNIRFFKKGSVTWTDKIHRPPETKGKGLDLLATEELAILHHHYESVTQFIERMDRYTNIQAKEKLSEGLKFEWSDLLTKPLGEFLSRYFANRGFEDGLHGLSLSLLQAFSFLIMYLKVWEMQKFKETEINLSDLKQIKKDKGKELDYWLKYSNLSKNPLKRIFQKVGNSLS